MKNQNNNIIPGDFVRITESFKNALIVNGSTEHVKEFGNCIGIVVGKTKYSDTISGPELDVRWQPSNLRYAYLPENLEKV